MKHERPVPFIKGVILTFAILLSLGLSVPALAATVGESGGVSDGAEIEYEPAPVPEGRTAVAALFAANVQTEAISLHVNNNDPDHITGFIVAAVPAGGGEALYGVRQGESWDYKIPFSTPPQEDTDFTITVTSQTDKPGFYQAGVKETVMTYNAIKSLTIRNGDTDATGKTLYLQTNNAQGRQSVQLAATKNGSSGGTGSTGHPYMRANDYAEAVAWSSSNEAVASVDATGLVTAHTGGTATITASVYGGKVKATCTVNVSAVTGVSLSHTAYTLFTGGTAAETQFTLSAALTGGLASDELEWTNSNPGAAGMTVAADGHSAVINATGKTAGSATITVHVKGAPDTAQYKASCSVTAVTIGSVSVSPASYTIYTLGEPRTVQLTATVTPNAAPVWASSNTAAATVNQTGLVTAVAPGSTTVTATVGGKSGSSTITVKDRIPVTSVTVSGTNSLMRTSDKTTVTTQLAATVKPDNAHFKTVSWAKTGGSAGININASGLVTATAAGTATFTATADGATSAPYTVTVTDQMVTGITVAAKSVDKGGTVQMSATVSPSNAVNKNVTWSLASGNVATVNASGLVTGGVGSNGTVTVKATADDGSGKSGSATVTVNGCAHALSDGGFGSGAGTSGSPWKVSTPAQLQHLNHTAHLTGGQHFLQVGDLDLSSYGDWTPIGGNNYSSFNGVYDGGGYVIRNMKISGSKENAGLFGVASGTIQNLGVDSSCQIDALGIRAGGLAAQIPQNGALTMQNCYSAASVRVTATGNSVIMGGLVGHAPNVSLDVAGCYFSGSLTAASGPYRYVGGLVGYPPHSTLQIKQCYSDGTLSIGSGTTWRGVGALFGYVLGTGTGGLSSNYWQSGKGASATIGSYGDVGPASNAGGTALSAAQMAQQSSFSGFDFTNTWRWDYAAARPRLQVFEH